MPVAPCPSPCPPITTGIVTFSFSEFIALWPEFAGLAQANAQTAFNDAQLLLDNTCGSAVQDANKRLILLYTLTAHVCALDFGTNDSAGNVTPPQGIVGRVANAAEGSVSVSAEYSSEVTQSEAYYIQTKYGAKYWQQTAVYRMAYYTGQPRCGPNGPGFPWVYGIPDVE